MDRAERDEFIGKLKRWKHEGCSILVAGEVLDQLRGTSDLLLGGDDRERYRTFVLTDADPDSVAPRLDGASPTDLGRRTTVLDYDAIARSAVADRGTTEDRATVEHVRRVPVSGDLDRLYDELTRTMAAFGDDLPANALRVSVDTLRPLLAEHDREAVGHWLAHVGNATKSYRGTVHYLLPKAYTSETVRDLREHVDAVIEVRSYDDGDDGDADRAERWHVPGADLTTPWRPMDDPGDGML